MARRLETPGRGLETGLLPALRRLLWSVEDVGIDTDPVEGKDHLLTDLTPHPKHLQGGQILNEFVDLIFLELPLWANSKQDCGPQNLVDVLHGVFQVVRVTLLNDPQKLIPHLLLEGHLREWTNLFQVHFSTLQSIKVLPNCLPPS